MSHPDAECAPPAPAARAQAPYHLGSPSQAISATEYLSTYLSKNCATLNQSLALLCAAVDHAHDYPSSAADSGTQQRNAIHVVQRFVNSSSMEVSDTWAAAYGLNESSFFSSHTFVTFNPYDFVSAATKAWGAAHQDDNSDHSGGDSTGDDDSDIEDPGANARAYLCL